MHAPSYLFCMLSLPDSWVRLFCCVLLCFVYLAEQVLPSGFDMLPPSLCGTHESENFSANWARELGLAAAHAMRLRPEIVCIAATDAAKLRAAARHVVG